MPPARSDASSEKQLALSVIQYHETGGFSAKPARLDSDGLESGRFGAETSGFVVLYDGQGKLLFRGGITAGRWHAGDNAGEDAILAALNHAASPLSEAPVFGCALLDRSKGEPVR